MTSHPSAPRGQITIVTAAAMVVLLGIASLVVDLGFAWMLRRQGKNRRSGRTRCRSRLDR